MYYNSKSLFCSAKAFSRKLRKIRPEQKIASKYQRNPVLRLVNTSVEITLIQTADCFSAVVGLKAI